MPRPLSPRREGPGDELGHVTVHKRCARAANDRIAHASTRSHPVPARANFLEGNRQLATCELFGRKKGYHKKAL